MSLRFRVSCVRTRILSRSGRSEVPAGTLPLPRVGGGGFARPSPLSRVAASLHLGLQSYKHFPTYGAPCAALSSRGQPPCSSRRGKVRQPLPAAVALRRGGTAHAPLWRSDPARPLLPKGTLVIARTKSLPLRERSPCRCANDMPAVARTMPLKLPEFFPCGSGTECALAPKAPVGLPWRIPLPTENRLSPSRDPSVESNMRLPSLSPNRGRQGGKQCLFR